MRPAGSNLTYGAAASVVRPPEPGQPVGTNWAAIQQLSAQVGGLNNALAGVEQRGYPSSDFWLSDGLHPFRVYTIPSILRLGTPDAADWRKVRVRAGRVLESDATGTDGHNADPDADTYPTGETVPEITVPEATAEFWIWLEIDTVEDTTTAVVRYGTDPTAESYDTWTSEKPWTEFPKLDGSHVPIAKVDSNTAAASRMLLVRQFLRTDLVSAGGTVRVKLCDPYTGEVKTYEIIGREITDPVPTP